MDIYLIYADTLCSLCMHAYSVCILCLQSRYIKNAKQSARWCFITSSRKIFYARKVEDIHLFCRRREFLRRSLSRFYDESARTLAVVNDIAEEILHVILRAANKIEETL
jgi:hypothetical protein